MPKQSLNQLQPKQSHSITHPSPCLSQRADGSKKCANSLGSYHALSGSPQQTAHLSTQCSGPLVSNPALSVGSLDLSCLFCCRLWLMAHFLRHRSSAYSLGSFLTSLISPLVDVTSLSLAITELFTSLCHF